MTTTTYDATGDRTASAAEPTIPRGRVGSRSPAGGSGAGQAGQSRAGGTRLRIGSLVASPLGCIHLRIAHPSAPAPRRRGGRCPHSRRSRTPSSQLATDHSRSPHRHHEHHGGS
jgi:hypothetical protein